MDGNLSRYTHKNSINAAIVGAGIFLSTLIFKSLNNIEKIQSTTKCTSFNRNPCTTIDSGYSHINASNETDIINFNNKLSFLVQHIPKHIDGDMNVHVGKDGNNYG